MNRSIRSSNFLSTKILFAKDEKSVGQVELRLYGLALSFSKETPAQVPG